MAPNNKRNKGPQAASPTPLRDWLAAQRPARQAALVVLAAVLIACGGQASFTFSFSPVPATQQGLFALAAGALLGSELGAVAGAAYLMAAAATVFVWPRGFGAAPLTGPLAGYQWSLPLMAYCAGLVVERMRAERPVGFAIGVCMGTLCFDAVGAGWLMVSKELTGADAFLQGVAFFTGMHMAQGALVVFIGSSASELAAGKRR